MVDGDKFLKSLDRYTDDELVEAGHKYKINMAVFCLNWNACEFFLVVTQEYFDDRD